MSNDKRFPATVISGGTSIGFGTTAKAWGYILRAKVYPIELVTSDGPRLIYSAEADSLPIEELEPSVRVYNILRRNGCFTWGDVYQAALYNDLRSMPNLGKKCIREVYNILSEVYPDKWQLENARLRDLDEPSENFTFTEDYVIREDDDPDDWEWGPEF